MGNFARKKVEWMNFNIYVKVNFLQLYRQKIVYRQFRQNRWRSSVQRQQIIRISKSMRVFVDQQNKYSDEFNPERFEATSI